MFYIAVIGLQTLILNAAGLQIQQNILGNKLLFNS